MASSPKIRVHAKMVSVSLSNAADNVSSTNGLHRASTSVKENSQQSTSASGPSKRQKKTDKLVDKKAKQAYAKLLLSQLAANKVDTSRLLSSRNIGSGSANTSRYRNQLDGGYDNDLLCITSDKEEEDDEDFEATEKSPHGGGNDDGDSLPTTNRALTPSSKIGRGLKRILDPITESSKFQSPAETSPTKRSLFQPLRREDNDDHDSLSVTVPASSPPLNVGRGLKRTLDPAEKASALESPTKKSPTKLSDFNFEGSVPRPYLTPLFPTQNDADPFSLEQFTAATSDPLYSAQSRQDRHTLIDAVLHYARTNKTFSSEELDAVDALNKKSLYSLSWRPGASELEKLLGSPSNILSQFRAAKLGIVSAVEDLRLNSLTLSPLILQHLVHKIASRMKHSKWPKGLHKQFLPSCIECRRRKKRCIIDPGAQFCHECIERDEPCIAQEYAEPFHFPRQEDTLEPFTYTSNLREAQQAQKAEATATNKSSKRLSRQALDPKAPSFVPNLQKTVQQPQNTNIALDHQMIEETCTSLSLESTEAQTLSTSHNLPHAPVHGRPEFSSPDLLSTVCMNHAASPVTRIDRILPERSPSTPVAPSQARPPVNQSPYARLPEIDPTPRRYTVHVKRSEEIQEKRMNLPILAEEQTIMECIHEHPITIILSETGSGKTTQIPQFLYEFGYGAPDGPAPGLIGITQPRRVATISMAKRVAIEMGDHGKNVAHKIRHEDTCAADTAIKFMTDGILLREIMTDTLLLGYSVIIIDEVHERSVNTDLLIGWLTITVKLRATRHLSDPRVKPLKVIMMSASESILQLTSNKSIFKDGPPPFIRIEGRPFTVRQHFAQRTEEDYVNQAFERIYKAHIKLPRGHILVFLTGREEITLLAKRLLNQLSDARGGKTKRRAERSLEDNDLAEPEDLELGNLEQDISSGIDDDRAQDKDSCDDTDRSGGPDDVLLHPTPKYALILPLYSQLAVSDQLKVFNEVPEDTRKIILATNIAETSITIPGIRYVINSGRAKTKVYDHDTGVERFIISWISKENCLQRAGRAGRTENGHCYNLFSSAVYQSEFSNDPQPAMKNTPLESVVLQLRSMGVPNVMDFPFPSPPSKVDLAKAQRTLSIIKAMNLDGAISDTGRFMSQIPLAPRYSKMIVVARLHSVMINVIAMVTALCLPEFFISRTEAYSKLMSESGLQREFSLEGGSTDKASKEQMSQRMKEYDVAMQYLGSIGDKQSDAMRYLTAFSMWLDVRSRGSDADASAFCKKFFLRAKPLDDGAKLFAQLRKITMKGLQEASGTSLTKLMPSAPTAADVAFMNQIVGTGFIDQVAVRADLAPPAAAVGQFTAQTACEVPYFTLFRSSYAKHPKGAQSIHNDKVVYIHSSSVLATMAPTNLPPYLIYSRLQLPSATDPATARVRMFPLAPISANQLVNIAFNTELLSWSASNCITKDKSDAYKPYEAVVASPWLVGDRRYVKWQLPKHWILRYYTKEGQLVIHALLEPARPDQP